MTYDIDYINKNWLVGGTVPYSEKQIVEAFNAALNLLGENWLNRFKIVKGIDQVGAHISISIIDIGRKLKILKRGANYESLIKKLKSNIETERIKGLSELDAIEFLCSENDIEFELEPQVLRIDHTPSYPDFRLRKKKDRDWIFVEVKQPDTSDENKIVRRIIKEMVNLITNYIDFHSVEIMLLRIPAEEEVKIIIEKCSFLFSQSDITDIEIKDIGLIVINHIEGIKYYPLEYEGFLNKPVLSLLEATIKQNENGEKTLHQPIVCRIAVNDERARRFLIDASNQLPMNCLNLIWVDSINVPDRRNWDKLIRKQFIEKPEHNKKISGFITYSNTVGFQNDVLAVIQNADLVVNNSADFQVPNWIREKIPHRMESRSIEVTSFVASPIQL